MYLSHIGYSKGMIAALIISAFTAGLLTFLAPCTLPLVPGYLGFISGISFRDIQDPLKARYAKRKVFINAVFYVVGFSLIFILFGSVVGWLGSTLLMQYRPWFVKIGGLFVIVFGVLMVQMALFFYESRWPALRKVRLPLIPWLTSEHRLSGMHHLVPGKPLSSLLFGAAFAFGWTPCVGPILGAILTLTATNVGVAQGAFLLAVFSLGLGIPFLIIAAGFGYFSQHLARITHLLPLISLLGGLFIIILGFLLFFNRLGIWISLFFQWFSFLGYERILNYL